MSKTQKAKVSDLIEDNLNANKGTDFGNDLMEKSFSKFGAGRSVLIDKNNKLIAENKSKAKFEEIGGENVLIIDADRDTLIAVRRNDIDLETPEGREFALADNATNKANLVWDADVIEVLAEDVEVEEWGVELPGQINLSSKNKELNIDDFEDELVLKLKYTESEYNIVKGELLKIADTPEQALWKLIKGDEVRDRNSSG